MFYVPIETGVDFFGMGTQKVGVDVSFPKMEENVAIKLINKK